MVGYHTTFKWLATEYTGPAEPRRDPSTRCGRFAEPMYRCPVDWRWAVVSARHCSTAVTWVEMARGLRSAKCPCQVTNSVAARVVDRRTITLGADSKPGCRNMIRHSGKSPTARWRREAGSQREAPAVGRDSSNLITYQRNQSFSD
jgi:hypothetical protein